MAVVIIDLYRLTLAGILGGRCRFMPTCSCYTREAFLTLGFRKGFIAALKRIGRCHPWGGHGYEPLNKITSGEKR